MGLRFARFTIDIALHWFILVHPSLPSLVSRVSCEAWRLPSVGPASTPSCWGHHAAGRSRCTDCQGARGTWRVTWTVGPLLVQMLHLYTYYTVYTCSAGLMQSERSILVKIWQRQLQISKHADVLSEIAFLQREAKFRIDCNLRLDAALDKSKKSEQHAHAKAHGKKDAQTDLFVPCLICHDSEMR